MSIQSTQLADAAQLLHDAQRSGIPISPLTQTYPNLDVAQAYSVQRLNLARYLDGGAVLRGHKIGPPPPRRRDPDRHRRRCHHPDRVAHLAATIPSERLGQTLGAAEVGRELGDDGGPLLIGALAATTTTLTPALLILAALVSATAAIVATPITRRAGHQTGERTNG